MIYGSCFSCILQCWLAKELVADLLEGTGQAEIPRANLESMDSVYINCFPITYKCFILAVHKKIIFLNGLSIMVHQYSCV